MAVVDAPFEEALKSAKAGERVTRISWDDEERIVVAQKGYPRGIEINHNTAEATGLPEGTKCVFGPYLMIREYDGAFTPYTPSQEDLFATDWIVV